MIEPFLRSQLEPVALRHRRLQLWRRLAACWAVAALVGLSFILLERLTGWSSPLTLPLLALGTGLAAFIGWQRSRNWQPDFRQIARQIEQKHPELHALLLTAVEQEPDATGGLNYLQERVVREAILESQKHEWIEAIPGRHLRWMQGAHLAALLALLAVFTQLRSPMTGGGRHGREAKGIAVTPGDALIERGHGLAVLARFTGQLPAEVTLVIGPNPQESRRIPLAKSLEDPVFGVSIPEVTTDLIYHVEYSGQQTRDYKIRVFEHPRLERADARLAFPEYTGLPEKKIEDTRRISAVEGSRLDLSLHLNKRVASAKLIAKDKSVVPLVTETNRAAVSLGNFSLQASQSYELQLIDAEGRTNKVPAQFVFDVLKNRTPELKFAFPRGDQRVSPLQEISFQAEAWDDFGLRAYGLTYTLAGAEPKTITLGDAAAANEKRAFNHLLRMEELSAQPDQFLSYFVWADDIGPDGQVRRSSSDMYFAEVRPFEEIFREGPSAEGQAGQQAGNESTKLAELQKQIISATWKLQRQSGSSRPPSHGVNPKAQSTQTPAPPASVQYKKDATVVQNSQEHALEQAQALKSRSSDPRAQVLLESVVEEMDKALGHLAEATKSPAPLPAALAAEQSAYQALLKLSAREYQVSQSRSQGGGGGGQRNQQQLDQLELKQSEDRYETQRQASPQQNAEQREQLQVLNRLKELAQRQEDLNERLKELQTALQEAKSEEEREELRRQLKRLREEEREMLADIDELRQRMEQPQNQSRMAEARQQLEQTRSEVQRAAEALENNSVSQALTSGTRAQRELQQLRDDFRKKHSSQFAEEMRQMRNDARDLAQSQEEIGRKIDGLTETKRKTLSDSGESKALADQLQQQKSGLTNLLEAVRTVSEQAEAAEPLLSKQLYETFRKTSQGNVENALTKTEEMLKWSFFNEANQFEQRAREQIDDLKRGVERAAESVLGDDTEALRLAKRELEDLAKQLEKEIAQASAGQQGADGIQATNSPAGKAPLLTQRGGSQGQRQGQQLDERTASTAGQSAQSSGSQTNQASGSNAGEASNQSKQQGGNEQATQQAEAQKRGQQSQAGKSSSGQNGDQAGKSEGRQAGQPAQNSPQGSAQGQSNQTGNQSQRSGAQQDLSETSRAGSTRGGGALRTGQFSPRNFFDQGGPEGGGGNGAHGPITGPEFSQWSDRLRDVEEMLDTPELRTEIARIRDRARAMRVEFKRHSKEPQWPLVQSQIAAPLAEVRSRVSEELARRESQDALVPIDRDPVPNKFSELVRRYYEKLGSSD